MNLPTRIEKCPIVDSVVEIRFSSNIFPSAVFGLLYDSLKSEFPKTEKLPILQIPETIIQNDPNLRFKPHYKMIGDGHSLQIGPEVLSVSSLEPYSGWSNYSKVIFTVMKTVAKTKIIDQVQRLGIRYTNFFDFEHLFDKINLDLRISGNIIPYRNTFVKTEIEDGGFLNLLQISNVGERTVGGKKLNGSVLDIDTYKTYGDGSLFMANYQSEIGAGRAIEKRMFFSLLKKEFIDELKPIYDDAN